MVECKWISGLGLALVRSRPTYLPSLSRWCVRFLLTRLATEFRWGFTGGDGSSASGGSSLAALPIGGAGSDLLRRPLRKAQHEAARPSRVALHRVPHVLADPRQRPHNLRDCVRLESFRHRLLVVVRDVKAVTELHRFHRIPQRISLAPPGGTPRHISQSSRLNRSHKQKGVNQHKA